jgi:outer membrane receptor protein involved in Fe transport
MTINSGAANAYNSLADFLLGLPNNDTGAAVAKPFQRSNPNALRWSQYAVYAQDLWSMTPKLTLNYGVRYEMYPAPYRDHTGVYRMDPTCHSLQTSRSAASTAIRRTQASTWAGACSRPAWELRTV